MVYAHIDVVGLGPAGGDLIPPRSLDVLSEIALAEGGSNSLWLRTVHHPAVDELARRLGVTPSELQTFDALYDTLDTFDEVYAEIAERLVAEARRIGRIGYIVPGSSLVLERSVRHLQSRADVRVVCHASMSFLDLAWAALNVDPVDQGVRLVDGHTFGEHAAGERGPFLVAHCHSRAVLSDIKLAFEPPDGTEVVLLHHLGLDDEQVVTVDYFDMDRTLEADHLTSLYIPQLARPLGSELAELVDVVDRLRLECPWDSVQTHQTLQRYVLEEAAETADAIDRLDDETGEGFDEFCGELGDVLFQVLIHARLASESGWFELTDVMSAVRTKLIERHPHVFGDAKNATTEEIRRHWEITKQAERESAGRTSAMDDIPSALPSTLFALKTLSRARGAGLGTPTASDAGGLVAGAATDLGSALFALVAACASEGRDPEQELKAATRRFAELFRQFEIDAAAVGSTVAELQVQLWEAWRAGDTGR